MSRMGYCRYCSLHTRKENSMKKCLIALFLLFSTVALAKTWEVNLRSCDGYGGFWFPNHNWTDKGEPWIKPLSQGESLEKYRETGVFFNYLYPTVDCPLDSFDPDFDSDWCVESNLNNHFDVRFTPTSSDNADLIKDSIYYFIGCSGKSHCDRDLLVEEVADANFVLNARGIVSFFSPKDDSIDWTFVGPPGIANVDTVNWESVGFAVPALDDFWRYGYSSKNGLYFVYKKNSDRFEFYALCNWDVLFVSDKLPIYLPDKKTRGYHALQCEFQDDGTLNFEKLPDVKTIPEDFCLTQSIPAIHLSRFKQKNNYVYRPFYKANGTPAKKNSSSIIIKNKQSKLQLKGEH